MAVSGGPASRPPGSNGDGAAAPAPEKPAAGARVEVAAPAKLNLALLVGPVRRDGFHEVFSLMVPVTLGDLVVAEAPLGDELVVDCVVCAGEENLAACAVHELEARLGWPLPVRLTIHKRVPHAAGLGGGSSDAAAALRAVEQLYDLGVPPRLLHEVAAAVGSDVPFFLWRGPQLAMGRGSVLKDVELPEPLYFVIGVPDVELPTKLVYGWRDEDVTVTLPEFAARTARLVNAVEAAATPADVAALMHNDLESHVTARRPEIAAVKAVMLQAGALAAAMSGSGSAVYGLFDAHESAEAGRAALIARAGLSPARVFTATDLQPGRGVG
jgi:4-diphosphocytidyl-2-C-methyl-D-erythritol kinase